MKRRFLFPGMLAILAAVAPARAETPAPFPDFTFKRVAVPKPGETNRIKVQIDPSAQPAPPAAALADPAVAPVLSGFEWFWAVVSPDLDKGGPANFNLALAELEKAGGTGQPRLQALQDIAAAHGVAILKATVGTDISPALVLALISVESGGRADAVSSAGASGVMQLIPATAERFGVADATDPQDNINGGVAYLAWLMKHFDQDPIMALAGYNAGENAVHDHGGVPPYAETRAYVPKVLSAWRVARGLCQTPPELITDGCVFTVKRTAKNG